MLKNQFLLAVASVTLVLPINGENKHFKDSLYH